MAMRKKAQGMDISPSNYQMIKNTVKDACGIDLGEEKQSLVVSRLAPLMERHGLESIAEFCRSLGGDQGKLMLSELVDSISTNHTFFNREQRHFEHFCEASLPDAIRANATKKKLRIWCAASSFGQEPYTLAMLMMNQMGNDYLRWDAGVLATDISNKVLAFAKAGRYPSDDLASLPAPLVRAYFQDLGDGFHTAKPLLKKEVLFRRFNLMTPKLPFRSDFDIVFCRNVMIYFDHGTKASLIQRIRAKLRLGGYLYIGAAESLPPNHGLTQVAPSVFRKLS